MLNVLQTTETDTPAVLDLTRDDHPAVALGLTSLYIHDDSLPTISCLESCTSVTILLLLRVLQLLLLMATLYWKYVKAYHLTTVTVKLRSFSLTPFSIDSNPETFCVEKPTIIPTVDACGFKDQSV